MLKHLGEILDEPTSRHGERIALTRESATRAIPISFGNLRQAIREFSFGLRALGIVKGDRVGVFTENSARWLILDLACLRLGAIDVPRGADTDLGELEYILSHSECRLLAVQNKRLLDSVCKLRIRLPKLLDLVVLDPDFKDSDAAARIFSFDDILERGRVCGPPESEDEPTRDDLATIVYTSGTTGKPKGVMLTHGNILHNVETLPERVEVTHEDRFLSVLPSWHMFERTVEYCVLRSGARITYTDKRRFKKDLREESPTLVVAVPRLWEVIHATAEDSIAKSGKLAQSIAACSLSVGRRFRAARRTSRGRVLCSNPQDHGPGSMTRLGAALLAGFMAIPNTLSEFLFFRKVRSFTGGKIRIAISGGGALGEHVERFFDTIGIPILNGYGLTETAPIIAVRDPRKNVSGTIGLPMPQTKVEVRDETGRVLEPCHEGILWVKGPQVMKGYYRQEEATRSVLHPDGWFNTGDLGMVTRDGHLVFTGRFKDTIVLASGENVQPEPIERILLQSPLIERCVVVGQDQRQLGVLIEPHLSAISEPSPEPIDPNERASLLAQPSVIDLIQAEVRRLSSPKHGFRSFEIVRAIRILPDALSTENGTLTQTLKIKRNVVVKRYKTLIDDMYL